MKALAIGLLIAVRRQAWRTPVLLVATVWNGLGSLAVTSKEDA